ADRPFGRLHGGTRPAQLPLTCRLFGRRLGMRMFASRIIVGVAWLSLWPVIASAQTSTIAGTVKDASGALLPGVTVEVSSPALIEKVRSVTTDGVGQY